MSVNSSLFKGILDNADETLKKYGYTRCEFADDNSAVYSGEHGVIKLTYENEKVCAFEGTDADNIDSAKKRIFLSLLPEDAQAKDINYVSSEFCSILDDKYGVKSVSARTKKSGNKPVQTVSKAAVKNGSFYDPITLASRLCLVFPEIRDDFKRMSSEGEFLYDEYFETYATPKIIDAINKNQPATMKKMFQVLNEVYEDGTNETQTLIAVSVLGKLQNNQVLLARCIDYMSQTMTPTVIEVNKYLATSGGKKALKKLENPPIYKPKKKKKKSGLMDMLMGGGSGTIQNQ